MPAFTPRAKSISLQRLAAET
ncbi:hypothetical protein BCAR13_520106 [Paraburkholderia caribensis]|nr:hypothetical protein BCAR13_520106 [Paraburkholderia caribensis]